MENSKASPLLPSPTAPLLPPFPSASVAATATDESPREELHREQPVRRIPVTPMLRFTPYAWAKLLFFRDAGDTEIGGFGITRLTEDDLLLVEDFITVKQLVSCVTVAFDDTAVADHFEQQVDLGRKPEQFGRIWIHTHPGSSAMPSGTDEETFARSFGTCDWCVMFILAKGGQTYTRLRFNVGPGGEQILKSEVDFDQLFAGSDFAAWTQEYEDNIFAAPLAMDLCRDARLRGTHEFYPSFRDRPHRNGRSASEDEELQEVLLDQYAEYWGVERGIFG